ncbi:MAG: FAD-dependent oxidoreductase [Candidatus Auribacterota bacterium]
MKNTGKYFIDIYESRRDIWTSGYTDPLWTKTYEPFDFMPLHENTVADTVIIGAGISGLSVAYFLAKQGNKVVVLDDGFIGSGESGRASARLCWMLDIPYSELYRRFGYDQTVKILNSHKDAVDTIEHIVRTENIACDFNRVDGYLFPACSDDGLLMDEYSALKKLGVKGMEIVELNGVGQHIGTTLRIARQAQFDPMKYMDGLSRAIVKNGGRIYTTSHVHHHDESGVVTSAGFRVDAGHIVSAAQAPLLNAKNIVNCLTPMRLYVSAMLAPAGTVKPALYLESMTDNAGAARIKTHARVHPYTKAHDILLVAGQEHRTGYYDDVENPYAALELWAQSRFTGLDESVFRWSGQAMTANDGLALIGYDPLDESNFVVSGQNTNGFTYGTIAGMLISDLITRNANPWQTVYSLTRDTLSYSDTLRNADGCIYSTLPYSPQNGFDNDIRPGEGRVIFCDPDPISQYRDEYNKLHSFSARCPFDEEVLAWNPFEKTFDCRTDGSRFTPYGRVINGPARTHLYPLEYVSVHE